MRSYFARRAILSVFLSRSLICILIFCSIALPFAASADQSARIEINILKASPARNIKNFPVAIGLVFPENKLKSPAGGKIVDDKGNNITFESEVTGWWDAEHKNIKWLLLRFRADTSKKYYFVPNAKKSEISGQPLAKSDGTAIEVNTGPLKAKLINGSGKLFDSITLNGHEMLSQNESSFLLTVDDKGKNIPTTVKDWKVEIEAVSPLRAELKATGVSVMSDGTPAAMHEVRYQFFKGESFVRVYHSFVWMIQNTKIGARLIGLNIKPAKDIAQNLESSFAGSKAFDVPVSGGKKAYLFQSDVNKCEFLLNSKKVKGGKKLAGWLTMKGSDSRSITVALRDAWQMYPTAFKVSEKGLDIEFWPSEGKAMGFDYKDIMPPSLYYSKYWLTYGPAKKVKHCVVEPGKGNVYSFMYTAEGSGRTNEIMLLFADKRTERKAAEINSVCQNPIVLQQDPKSAMKVPFMGFEFIACDRERFPDIERAVTTIGDIATARFVDMHDYGFWRYGAARWGRPGVDLYRWMDGLQYDIQLIPWLLFLRGNGRRFFVEGEILARFGMDVATNHYTTRNTVPGFQSSALIMPFPWNPEHTHKSIKIHFLQYYYHLTGYRRAKQVIDMVIKGAKHEGANPKRAKANKYYRQWGREIYNMNVFWNNAYEETFDPEIKKYADEWLELSRDREYNPELKIFRGQKVYIYEGLTLQHRRTKDKRLKKIMLEHLKHCGFAYQTYGGVYDAVNTAGCDWAFRETGNKRFALTAWDIARSISDITANLPQARDKAPTIPYSYMGNRLYRLFLLPMLVGESLASRLGLNDSTPYVRSDTFFSLDWNSTGKATGMFYVKPEKSGNLKIKMVFSAMRGSIPKDVSLKIADQEGRVIVQKKISNATYPTMSNRYTPRFFLFPMHTEVTIPNADSKKVYTVEVTADNRRKTTALLLAKAQIVYKVPSGTPYADFGQVSGQYHAGARAFAKTDKEIVSIYNSLMQPYSIRDAKTGEVLFSSTIGDPRMINHKLGKDRLICITTIGYVNPLLLRSGLKPYVSSTAKGWFDPSVK